MTTQGKTQVQLALELTPGRGGRGCLVGMPRGEWDQRLLDAAAQYVQLLRERAPAYLVPGAVQDFGPTLANALWATASTGEGTIVPNPTTWEERRELHRVTLYPGENYAALELRYTPSLTETGEWRFYFEGTEEDGMQWREQTLNTDLCFTNQKGDILLSPAKPCDLVHPLHRGIIARYAYGWPHILISVEPTLVWLAQVEWLLWKREDNPLTALCQARGAYRTAGQQIVSHMEALRVRLIQDSQDSMRKLAPMYRLNIIDRKRFCDGRQALRLSLEYALTRVSDLTGAIDVLVNGQAASPFTGLLARGNDPLMMVYGEAIKAHLIALRDEIGECARTLKKQWDEL